MATVGQQLLQPEVGWKRYDNTDVSISYINWTDGNTTPQAWNTTTKLCNVFNGKASFQFIGTKMRIIALRNANRDTQTTITIDGVDYFYNENGNTQYQTLMFEIDGLEIQKHDVVITKSQNTNNSISLDAIDIDENGVLLPCTPTRYLIKDSSSVKTIENHELKTLSITTPTKHDFIENGITDLKSLIESKTEKGKPMSYQNDMEGGKVYSLSVDRAEIPVVEKIEII